MQTNKKIKLIWTKKRNKKDKSEKNILIKLSPANTSQSNI